MATTSDMLEIASTTVMLDETTVDSKRVASAVVNSSTVSTLATMLDIPTMSSMVDDDEDEDEDEDEESTTDSMRDAITVNPLSGTSYMENVSDNIMSTMSTLLDLSTTEKMDDVSTSTTTPVNTITLNTIAEDSTEENDISEDYIEEMNVFESKRLLNYRKRY